jgi:porin
VSDQPVAAVLGEAGQGVELFYNAEIRPWFHVTADVQLIDPARAVSDALLFGLRAKIDL